MTEIVTNCVFRFSLINVFIFVVHVWDYRRLILNKIGLDFEKELQFTTERINEDFSNYSSWHYRSTLMKLDEENIDVEITLVQNAVFTDPSDSSAWFYLRWVLSHSHLVRKERYEQLKQAFDDLAEFEPQCKCMDGLINMSHDTCFCGFHELAFYHSLKEKGL